MYNTAVINWMFDAPNRVMKIEDLRNEPIYGINVVMNSSMNEIVVRETRLHKGKATTNCFIKSITPPTCNLEIIEAKYHALNDRYDNVTLLLTDTNFVKALVVSELGRSSVILGQIRR